ncbi:nicotinamide riboside transporter PnuC [Kineobactrum salinum]|uniref:Nicotinamide riboside transporter PnuC n=1 Tax=Kineobactrum salinum TaxID=2708301 RepID=A0A6C0U3A8_9GAMM|nr:nicotinamide riboside transporter PnuC [Kineobactrum salinum]QIB66650.1 nicotinamide mononucleotide transporter [Kineobactrum salinum]
MTDSALSEQLASASLAMSGWEVIAVALGIAYLLLAVRESLWCWYAAFGGTAIYLWLFWQVRLPMESALQLFYLAMAVYGWQQWRSGARSDGRTRPISRWPARTHLFAIITVLSASAVSGALLQRYTDAALPYLDSFTTWGSVLTTWMVARKVLENWVYWLVIDSACIYLYLERGLLLTAVLFMVYLIIVVFGFFQWRQHYHAQSA